MGSWSAIFANGWGILVLAVCIRARCEVIGIGGGHPKRSPRLALIYQQRSSEAQIYGDIRNSFTVCQFDHTYYKILFIFWIGWTKEVCGTMLINYTTSVEFEDTTQTIAHPFDAIAAT